MAAFEARSADGDLPSGINEDTEGARRIAQTYDRQDDISHRLSVSVNRFGEVVLTDIFDGGDYQKAVSVLNLDEWPPSARQWRGGLVSEKRPEGAWQTASPEEVRAIMGRVAYTLEHDITEAA